MNPSKAIQEEGFPVAKILGNTNFLLVPKCFYALKYTFQNNPGLKFEDLDLKCINFEKINTGSSIHDAKLNELLAFNINSAVYVYLHSIIF